MPHDTVYIGYCINVTNCCGFGELLIRRFIVHDSRCVNGNRVPVFPFDFLTEFSNRSDNYISKFLSCVGKMPVRLLRSVSGVKNINGSYGRFVIRV